MTDSKYTKAYVSLPKEMMERAKNAEGYSGAAEYIRAMAAAGESNIADLDPRTLNGSESENGNKKSSDLDNILLDALDDEYTELDEILENGPRQRIADRLLELATQDGPPVAKNGLQFRIDE